MAFKVKFWGVRGSIACPGPHHLSYGGNTSCVEVAMGGRRVIFDAGTGIRNLGKWFLKRDVRHAWILMSHTHWDHINGFPFFTPAFMDNFGFDIMAGHLDTGLKIETVMSGQMTHPFFPVPIDTMKARIGYSDFKAGDQFNLAPDIRVRTAPLNHPDGATGYRIDYQDKSICYVTDTEHEPGKPNQNILGLIEGADLVIYDCTYSDAEFDGKRGWGHSTWQEGVRLAQAANVKRLAIFHHDPDHEDPFMERIEAQAFGMWSGAIVARDNMRVNIL
jgi:phosphoribosyl 1,2-cyclic phosphodiesterase